MVDEPVVGGDPGLHGALSWYGGGKFHSTAMKYRKIADHWFLDMEYMGDWFEEGVRKLGIPRMAYLEKVHSMPRDGKPAIFSFGWVASAMAHFLHMHEIPITFVRPQDWQVLIATDKSEVRQEPTFEESKRKVVEQEAALRYLKRLFPTVNLLATDRSRVPHSGLVDSMCIALYGHQQYSLSRVS